MNRPSLYAVLTVLLRIISAPARGLLWFIWHTLPALALIGILLAPGLIYSSGLMIWTGRVLSFLTLFCACGFMSDHFDNPQKNRTPHAMAGRFDHHSSARGRPSTRHQSEGTTSKRRRPVSHRRQQLQPIRNHDMNLTKKELTEVVNSARSASQARQRHVAGKIISIITSARALRFECADGEVLELSAHECINQDMFEAIADDIRSDKCNAIIEGDLLTWISPVGSMYYIPGGTA